MNKLTRRSFLLALPVLHLASKTSALLERSKLVFTPHYYEANVTEHLGDLPVFTDWAEEHFKFLEKEMDDCLASVRPSDMFWVPGTVERWD